METTKEKKAASCQLRKLLFVTKKEVQAESEPVKQAYIFAMAEGLMQGLVMSNAIEYEDYIACRNELAAFRNGTEAMKKALE